MAIINKFCVLKKVGENANMMRRKSVKKMQMKLLEIKKNTVSDISTLDGSNSRLGATEEKISEIECSNRNCS